MAGQLRRRETGFPKGIKVVLGVALLAVVAAIAIPNLLEPKISWNDWSALACIRNLTQVQEDFRSRRLVDLDGDGSGEYGTFGEMTGADGVRLDPTARERGAPVALAMLSSSLTDLDDGGRTTRSGYFFRILLPGKGGTPVHEKRASGFSGPVDTDSAERSWCVYAWPVQEYGELKGTARLHNRVFFADASGNIWQTMNQDRRYCGDRAPSWDAAMPEDGWGVAWTSPPANVAEYRGRDGNVWKRVD